MDILSTIEADSTQVNADDLTSTPRIVTISGVSKGTADQPVNIELVEFPGRAYRPCKSMRRVLVHAWGPDAAKYIGRRMAIFNDPKVRWGGQDVGGVRIKALSDIDKRITVALTVTRGKRSPYVVEPLPAGPPLITDDQAAEFATAITNAEDSAALTTISAQLKTFDLGAHKDDLLGLGKSRYAELSKPAAEAEATK